MASHISPVVLREEIGRRIRLARHGAGLTIVEAAERLEISRSVLNRYETGEGTVSVHMVRSMMDIYDQRLDDVLEMVRQARAKGWWKQYGISDKDFVALETGASRVQQLRTRIRTRAYSKPPSTHGRMFHSSRERTGTTSGSPPDSRYA